MASSSGVNHASTSSTSQGRQVRVPTGSPRRPRSSTRSSPRDGRRRRWLVTYGSGRRYAARAGAVLRGERLGGRSRRACGHERLRRPARRPVTSPARAVARVAPPRGGRSVDPHLDAGDLGRTRICMQDGARMEPCRHRGSAGPPAARRWLVRQRAGHPHQSAGALRPAPQVGPSRCLSRCYGAHGWPGSRSLVRPRLRRHRGSREDTRRVTQAVPGRPPTSSGCAAVIMPL